MSVTWTDNINLLPPWGEFKINDIYRLGTRIPDGWRISCFRTPYKGEWFMPENIEGEHICSLTGRAHTAIKASADFAVLPRIILYPLTP